MGNSLKVWGIGMVNIIVSKQAAVAKMQSELVEGNNIVALNNNRDINVYSKDVEDWKEHAVKLFKNTFDDDSLAVKFEADTFYLENSFSKANTKSEITQAVKRGASFLQNVIDNILNDVYKNKYLVDNDIPKDVAIVVIRRLLQNFYKHIEAMYQKPVHSKARILKADLDRIKIGNEYDVQRILYSIIVPVFPLARLEVTDDTGYNSVRYDICLDEYDIVIEVKCTRDSMSERTLTEELGSDIFHYQSKNLFFFVYDKEKIIRNVDAFIKVYTRQEESLSKNLETIVIQPIVL